MSETQSVKFKLYSYFRSSCAWRVRIALNYKNVKYEIVPVNLRGDQRTAAFHATNPIEQVPVLELEHGGALVRITQSMAILEYLEERYPERPLLPADALGRARARQLSEVVNSGIQPLQNLKLQLALKDAGLDPVPLVQSFITFGLRALTELAAPFSGRYLLGNEPSFPDVFLVPQLFMARRMGVDLTEFPRLTEVEAHCQELSAFRAAHPTTQPDFDPTV
jgi:maleylpyruvate isomerase